MKKEFKITDAEKKKIEAVARRKPNESEDAMIGRINEVWAEIGATRGFNWETVEPVEGKTYEYFMAEIIERPTPEAPKADLTKDPQADPPATRPEGQSEDPPMKGKPEAGIEPVVEEPLVEPIQDIAVAFTPEKKPEPDPMTINPNQGRLFGDADEIIETLLSEDRTIIEEIEKAQASIDKKEIEISEFEARRERIRGAIKKVQAMTPQDAPEKPAETRPEPLAEVIKMTIVDGGASTPLDPIKPKARRDRPKKMG